MRLQLCHLFFLLAPLLLSAQSSAEEQAVQALFEQPAAIEWIQHYKGRIDDVNDIAVTLGFDGKNCKGHMLYLRSKERFELEGTLQNKILLLTEKSGSLVSGHIQAEVLPEGIVGEWHNTDQSIGGQFHLNAVKKPVEFPSYCGDNKWIHFYKGVIVPYESNLLLQKESDNQLRGILFIQRENKSYNLSGQADAYGYFKLAIKDIEEQFRGYLVGKFQKDQLSELKFVTTGGYQKDAVFRLEEALPVACVEFADFISSYDITYPKTQHVPFNRWMEALTDQWVDKCRNYSKEVRALNDKNTADLRASVRSFAWSDLDFYSAQLISGLLTMNNSWSTQVQTRTINFDFVEGKEILLKDLFREGFNHRTFIDFHLRKQVKNLPLYKQSDTYRKWVAQLEFPHFTIRQDGLCFSSDFNAIYGQQRVLISYEALRPYLRKENPVAYLYQQNGG
ncbi:MAG: hypothetical protein AAFV95_01390 [Bacteroidota bacterium]